jgi:hypothetical protein
MSGTTVYRRLQFGLRSLFAGIAVLAVFLAGLVYNLNWIRDRRNAPVYEATCQVSLRTPSGPKLLTLTAEAPWPLEWLGEYGRHSLLVFPSLSEDEVERIRELFPEAEIEVMSADVASEANEYLSLHQEGVEAHQQRVREEIGAARREWAEYEAETRKPRR